MNNIIEDFPFHPSELLKDFRNNELQRMQITFINMPLRESALPNTPPEGPGILSSIVREYGGEPHIIDLNAYRIKDEESQKRQNYR